ncbi:MAG: nuclear transport factor 2 family protein [Candidatus Dormibacteraeota bacterium]|nr:nuclear transport factor 2 family protein [Candidatus Dormibacteraeota bacterium]
MSDLSTEQIEKELRQLYEDWFLAIPRRNPSFFERILSDDWYYTNYVGEVRGKREYLEYIAPIDPNVPPNRLVELVVRPFDQFVIVHGRYVVSDKYAPPGGPDTRFTAVWVRRGGEWKALTHHATTVPRG